MLKTPINPSLISFKPRQVLLAKLNMKHSNDVASAPTLKPDQKALLLRSIAGYLKSNGFSKTLKKFLSEAKLEKDDFSDSSLELEGMYCKYLESCDPGSTNFSRQKMKDDADPELNKSKEKRKSKKVSDSLGQAEQVSADVAKKPVDNVVCDAQLHESEKKQKEKKKKKSKSDSESLVDNVERLASEDKQGTKAKDMESLRDSQANGTKMMNANNILLEKETVKSKSKKKKKDDSVYQSLCDGDLKEFDEGKSSITESKKDDNKTSEEDATVKESKGSKKRKRLATEENNSQPIDKIEVEESKRRKTEGSAEPKGSDQVADVDASMEKSSLRKTTKNQMNGSAEPNTVKAFQRVKVDEVVFTDERLKDNSYWAKDGADSGYGAKAEEVLGQVRGRDFRHEKTKKKRGSYRGGQIDLNSHSIKFSYSDED